VTDTTTDEVKQLSFPAGLPGFPELQRFALQKWVEDPEMPYSLLVSLDEPNIRFLVAPPEVFFPDYTFEMSDADAAGLELASADDALVLVFITVPEQPTDATANLLGPVVINTKTLVGAQIVLAESGMPTKKPLVSAAAA
jgi:flagellar assembly factor FliW